MTYSEAISRCWLEVDLDKIVGNYETSKILLENKMVCIPVLKANAYGMGTAMIGKTLFDAGCRTFAVAAPGEAEQLRNAVPDADILLMGLCGEEAAVRLIRKNVILTMYSTENGNMIAEAAGKAGKPARVHIKVDTGLHRLGFDPETCAAEVSQVMKNNKGLIEADGLFTHLAIHSAEADHVSMEILKKVNSQLISEKIHVRLVHAMDSIGMVRYSKSVSGLNAARIGAWLYGVEPRGDKPFKPECPAKFCARISQIRNVKKGELIGYDDDSPLQRDSVIATITAGYIDGTPRIGNDWMVEINGKLAPVVGIACMDQLMCDVTDLGNVKSGDTAVFCGGMIDNESYSVMGKFNHNEAWARIGRRVPRVYMKNNEIYSIESEM